MTLKRSTANQVCVNIKELVGESIAQAGSRAWLPFLFIAVILSLSLSLKAQTSVSQNFTLSYTGLHASTTLQLKKGCFGFYAGPKILLTQSSSFLDGPWGIDAGVNYFLPAEGKKLHSFVNATYFNTYTTKRVSNEGFRPEGMVHEFGIGYGLLWNAGERISVFNQINVGRYTEVHHHSANPEGYSYSGFNTMIKLGVTYRLNDL
jgi:hypothetical protein